MKTIIKQTLDSKQQYEQLFNADQVSVLVFSAEWCPDCQFIKPFLPKLMEKYADYNFYYVDRDQNIELAQELMVLGIPSFVGIGKGQELGRFVSRLRKTEAQIDEFLSKL